MLKQCKHLLTLIVLKFSALLLCAQIVVAQEPPKLDFIGGFFENGVYRCYAEPCFSIHKDTYPGANNIRFRFEDWPHWLDLDDNCQNEKYQILAATSLIPVTYEFDNECNPVIAGEWLDPFTGERISDLSQLSIEHRISLQEAHYFGGSDWPRNKRALFANSPENLVVVSREQRKARRGLPANKWMPPNKSYWCDYVVHRELIARKFELNLPDTELAFNKEIKNLYCKY